MATERVYYPTLPYKEHLKNPVWIAYWSDLYAPQVLDQQYARSLRKDVIGRSPCQSTRLICLVQASLYCDMWQHLTILSL